VRASLRAARGLKWAMALGAPAFSALMGWIAWEIVRDRLAGRGWENVWVFAFVLATLAGLALLFLTGLLLVFRGWLEVGEEGLALRGVFRTRAIPWKAVAGYRLISSQMNVYVADWKLPINLGHFEGRERLYEEFRARVPDLDAVDLALEKREILEDQSLGRTGGEKTARLAELRRIVRPLNWSAYSAAAIGGVNALFVGYFPVQAAAACVLVVAPFALLMLALAYPGHVRLTYREGTAYPEGLSGILWASLLLGLMSLTDPHTLLGEEFYYWAVPLAVGFGGLWLYAEWDRLRESLRSWAMPLVVLLVGFLSGFWAGGTIYQANTVADLSAPVWGESRVIELRITRSRAGPDYHVKVAPWSASREPVELDISRETYQSLRTGMRVEIGVRAGLLGISWVETVRPKR
jgi:hypothetical protein